MPLAIFWYRRDLRTDDNAGLYHALKESQEKGWQVQPIFIFDTQILGQLDADDTRVPFIHQTLTDLQKQFQKRGADLWVFEGKPSEVFEELFKTEEIGAVYTNHDYEPQAIQRDEKIQKLCEKKGIDFKTFKDQVIFEKSEILTDARKPYTVYTPYKKKWLAGVSPFYLKAYPTELYFKSLKPHKKTKAMPSLKQLGFSEVPEDFYPPATLEKKMLKDYGKLRDFPALEGATSRLGLHLRFGTLSIRELAREAKKGSDVWLSELIWRDFFMQILFHFPHVEKSSFRPEYEKVEWRSDKKEFQRWCDGMTGYPIVDAGMRELNTTGHMHNRVRMVVASFLTKHLLMHWSLGERYFAKKLLDFDLAANNGNWQWAAGTGCDAAPYFRIFNPESQTERFDQDLKYIKKWVPELGTKEYPESMVDHKMARDRALQAFAKALKGRKS